jgi:multidrug/hemolysin transport system permease protein
MTVLLKRNVKLFFRDKANFFFSILSIIIIIGLYVLFLGNVWGDAQIRAMPGANVLRNSWLAAGLLAVTSFTTPLGALSVIIDDRTDKIYKAFYASPIKRSHITAGYILSAFSVGVIMTIITAVAWMTFIAFISGGLFPAGVYFRLFGLIFLASFANTAFVYFIASLVRTHSAFNTVTATLGTLVGFLMAIYLPLGVLPEAVQTAIKLFPPSHTTVLLRQTIMEIPMQVTFDSVPASYIADFQEMMGVVYSFGDFEITPAMSVVVLVGSAVVLLAVAIKFNNKK